MNLALEEDTVAKLQSSLDRDLEFLQGRGNFFVEIAGKINRIMLGEPKFSDIVAAEHESVVKDICDYKHRQPQESGEGTIRGRNDGHPQLREQRAYLKTLHDRVLPDSLLEAVR